MHRKCFPKSNNKHWRIFLVDRLMMQVDVVDQFDRFGVVNSCSADGDAELKLPGHLDRQEQPGDDPQKQMQNGSDHKDQDCSVQRSLVDYREVVEKRAVAHRQRYESTHGSCVGEVEPQRGLPLGQQDCLLLPLCLKEGHKLLVSVHVDDGGGGRHDHAGEQV